MALGMSGKDFDGRAELAFVRWWPGLPAALAYLKGGLGDGLGDN